jgi:hypothetical protein
MLVLRGCEESKDRADGRFMRKEERRASGIRCIHENNREKRVWARQIFSTEKMTRI